MNTEIKEHLVFFLIFSLWIGTSFWFLPKNQLSLLVFLVFAGYAITAHRANRMQKEIDALKEKIGSTEAETRLP